jgi:hypothetical protein
MSVPTAAPTGVRSLGAGLANGRTSCAELEKRRDTRVDAGDMDAEQVRIFNSSGQQVAKVNLPSNCPTGQ